MLYHELEGLRVFTWWAVVGIFSSYVSFILCSVRKVVIVFRLFFGEAVKFGRDK